MCLDDPVQVRVDEVLARGRAPVPQEQLLDVLQLQRLAEQGIVAEVDLGDRQVIGGPPVGVDLAEFFRASGRPSRLRRATSAGSSIGFDRREFVGDGWLRRPARESGRGPGDHRLFVGADDPDLDRPVVGRDQQGTGCVSPGIDGDPEEFQAVTDAAADLGRVLADPPGEHQGIKPAERGGERHRSTSWPGSRTTRSPRPPGHRRPCRARRSRTSELVSETPSRPESWFTRPSN